MKNYRSLLAVATIIIIGMVSCSKGSTGPAGPAGPSGPDSVIYSPWINLNFVYNANDTLYEDTLTVPSLTKAILDSGVILTYVNFLVNGVYQVISVSSFSANGVGSIFEDYSIGFINILSPSDYSTLPYRYVLIPGSLVATNKGKQLIKGYTPQELKAMSYAQVQQVLSDKN